MTLRRTRRRDLRRELVPARRRTGGRSRKLVIFGGLAAVGAAAWRLLRRPTEWQEPSFEPAARSPASDWPAATASADVTETETVPPPPEPEPPSEADQADREIESRLDDETKYERSLEQEEAARHEAAERLRHDPLLESRREET